MANLQCAELEQIKNLYGGYDCKTWVEVPEQQPPLLPTHITFEDTIQLSTACAMCFCVAWVLRELRKAF